MLGSLFFSITLYMQFHLLYNTTKKAAIDILKTSFSALLLELPLNLMHWIAIVFWSHCSCFDGAILQNHVFGPACTS